MPDDTIDDPRQIIADLQRQVVQYRTERDEALAQQAASAEVLQVINSSPGDLAPVFDAMLERAVRLCELDFASLWTYDGSLFHPVARHRLPDPLWAYLQDHTPPTFARLVDGDRLVHIADIRHEAIYQTDFVRDVRSLGLDTARSLLIVPLRRGEVLLGVIIAYRQEVRPFSDKQIALLENFAAQAVIAMENARLLGETREALDQQTATAEVLQVINSSPGDLAPVFDAMLEKAHTLCGASFGALVIREGELFRAVALRGPPAALAAVGRRAFRSPPDSPVEQMLRGEPFIQVPDMAELAARAPEGSLQRALVELAGVRTQLLVALRKDDALLGFISAYRQEVRPFSDREIALLQNFAAQAVIAMENARLITETREALEQQTATAEVLQVINSSPGDLAPVFDAMLDKAMRLCEAAFGTLRTTHDGERFDLAALRRVPPALAEYLEHNPPTIGSGRGPARILEGEQVVHVLDAADDETYRSGPPGRRAHVDLGGARTILSVGMRKDDAVLGVITIYRQEVKPFTDKQIALLENFAAQAVIAMENARLLTETHEALEQQTATAEVLQVINSSPGDLAPVFDAILEKAHTLCGAEYGVLLTYDGERFRPAAVHGSTAAFETEREGFRPGFAFGRLIRGERFVHIHDMAEVAAQLPDDPRPRALVEISGIRTQLAVPLRKDDKLLGIITANRREVRPFTDKQIALLENFAAQAVIAMENARLLTETHEALEQQTATAEVLQVINSSPGDLAPVFDAMLEKATSLCEASFGILWIFDGEFARAGALHQVPEAYAELCRAPFRPSPGSGPARIMQGEDSFAIADLTAYPPYQAGDALTRAVVDLGGARSIAITPLRKDDITLGAITIYQQELRPFSDKQNALLENFAAQAVIAMENARLLSETREALEQQTATAEVLQVINSSPGDLAPVFEAILEKAHSLCAATYGGLVIRDGDHFNVVAIHGEREFAAYWRQLGPLRPPEDVPSPLLRLMQGEPVVQVLDVRQDEFFSRSGPPGVRQLCEIGDVRTLLLVPLRKDAALLGVITAFRQEVRPFSDKQIALLQNFAAQAVIAMENARLITETREALDQQTATSEVLQVINASPGDLAPVFDAVLEKATRVCEAAFGVLWTHEDESFQAAALRGVPPAYAEFVTREQRGSRPGGALGRLARGEQLVHIPDTSASGAQTDGIVRTLVELGGIRTLLAVPLRKDGALLGAFTIYRQEVRPFSEKQIALLQNFAAQAVIAMENARLLGELRARTDEIAGWNRELEERVAAQLAELERTGRLKRFLAPQLAELIVAQGDESILESHRREIVVVFCDLRGFTGFAERAEPEEVMALLRDYHAAMGPIVASFEGTLDHYAGDGIMVFFNDPLPTPEPARRAIEMAVAMRKAAAVLLETWHRLGHDIGFGVGISQGYATLGQIGFAERMDYTAIGTVTNLAARLCAEAQDGQILIGRRVATTAGDMATLEEVGDLSLKGLSQAVAVYNVAQ